MRNLPEKPLWKAAALVELVGLERKFEVTVVPLSQQLLQVW